MPSHVRRESVKHLMVNEMMDELQTLEACRSKQVGRTAQ